MEVNMKRIEGSSGLKYVECTDRRLQKYRVRTDFKPHYDEETGEERGVTFIETEFPYKPSMKKEGVSGDKT